MEVIRKEAELIHHYIKATSIEDIIAFLRKVPLNKKTCRKELAILYFLQQMKNEPTQLQDSLLKDTEEILQLFPHFDKSDVLRRLESIFNVPNRKDVVVYQIIQHKKDLLSTILPENYSGQCLKRKSNEDLQFDNPTDVIPAFKIIKINNNFEIIKNPVEAKTTSSDSTVAINEEVLNVKQKEFSPIYNTVCANASTSDNSDVARFNNLYDSAAVEAFVQEPNQKVALQPNIPECDGQEIVITSSDACDNFCDFPPPNSVNIIRNVESSSQKLWQPAFYTEDYKNQPSTSKASNMSSNTDKNGHFDLVKYLSDITGEPKFRVRVICEFHKIPLNAQLPFSTLNRLIKIIKQRASYKAYSDSSDSDSLKGRPLSNNSNFVNHKVSSTSDTDDEYWVSKRGKKKMLQKRRKLDERLKKRRDSESICVISDDEYDRPIRMDGVADDTNIEVLTEDKNVEESTPTSTNSNIPIPSMNNNSSNLLEQQEEPEEHLNVDQELYRKIIEIFSDICPNYLKRMCRGKTMSEDFDTILNTLINLSGEYPKRQVDEKENVDLDMEKQLEILKEFLPDADPVYLEKECQKFTSHDDLMVFVSEAMEQRNYPTMKEYLRKQQLSAQQRQYTTEFDIANFVKLFPDPKTVFEDSKRQTKVNGSEHYLQIFMRNAFPRLPIRHIQNILSAKNYQIKDSMNECQRLMSIPNAMIKSRRRATPLPQNEQNIPLLQEIAYYQHRDEILEYIKLKKEEKKLEIQKAKQAGLLETCACCFDDEILPNEILTCSKGCHFCKDCIKKSVEVAFGDGKINFPCLADCSAEFSLQTIQAAVSPKLFSKLAQKQALAEVKAAGIEDLESCPFCDFANIINNQEDKIFRCLNPDCMKESCRLCKEPSHIPLKCDEVEKDEAVKARTYVENKMTEALLRKCYKCGTKFFKEEGCNKMTCSCGAQMCYICGKAVTNYKHFNGIGGDRYDLCPLYSDNNALNAANVMKGAEEAKALVKDQLKIDPTADINKHYEDRQKKLPTEPHLQHLQNIQQALNPNYRHPPLPRHGRRNQEHINQIRREFFNFIRQQNAPPEHFIVNIRQLWDRY